MIFLVLGGISSILTNTRYVMVSFIIVTFQIVVLEKNKTKALANYLIVLITFIGVIYFFLDKIGYDLIEWYNNRLFAEGAITETTRYKAISNFLIFFPQAPIFGNGGILTEKIISASAAVGSSQIHVGYLILLVYWGIVGALFLLGFWFLLGKRLYNTAKKTGYWGSFFAFLTFLWAYTTMTVDSIFYYGLIFSLVFDKYFNDLYNKKLISMKNVILQNER